jgi:hypothetical protein
MAEHTEKPTATAEIWLMIDDDGDYVATHDVDRLTDEYTDNIGGSATNTRTIKLSLTVPLPYTVEISGAVPDTADDAAEIALTVEG